MMKRIILAALVALFVVGTAIPASSVDRCPTRPNARYAC
jgi:hypothetical protein